MTEQKIDDGINTVTASDAPTADNRSQSNALAALIAATITKNETALAITAKDYTVAILRTVYQDGNNLDLIIKENKLAAGFKTLGVSEAGKRAKSRLSGYFSSIRYLAENWDDIPQDKRDAMLNGETSPLHQYNVMKKAEAEADKAKAKAEAEALAPATETPSLVAQAEALLAAYLAAGMDERNEAFDAMSAIFAAMDEDTKAQAEAETAPLAKAA